MRRVTFLPEPDFCFALSVNHSLWDLNDVTLAYGDGYCDAVKTTKVVSSIDFLYFEAKGKVHKKWNQIITADWTRNEMCRDFYVKISLTFFGQMILPIRNQMVGKVKQWYLAVTWVLYWWLILLFGSWGVREGQNMAQNGSPVYEHICKVFCFGAL